MADDRERTTHVSASIDVEGHGFDLSMFSIAAADLCEEHGFTEAAELLRAVEGFDSTDEPNREAGWASNRMSRTHFWIEGRTPRAGVTICGRFLEPPRVRLRWFHRGHVCKYCIRELERRQDEFPEAWEAHLISMDEARPILAAPEMTDEPTGKERSE